MGTISTILVIIDGVLCFILGLWVLLKNITRNFYFSFFIFSWSVAVWAMIRYAFYTSDELNIFLYRETYSAGGFVLLAAGPMLLYFLNEKTNRYLISFYYLAGIFLISVPFWDHITITNLTLTNNTLNYDVGFPYYLYFALTFFPLLYVFVRLVMALFTGSRKLITLLLLGGFMIFITSEFVYGFVLPALKIAPAVPVDSFASIIFILMAAFAISNYEKEKPAY